MSHACVLVTGNVDNMMSPYDENKEMRPYKRYMSDEDIERMREHYEKKENKSLTDEDLLEHMDSWNGRDGGIDKKGMYYWSTYNPDSKWDWYELGGRYPRKLKLKKGCKGDRGNEHWGFKMDDKFGSYTCKKCYHKWKHNHLPKSHYKECPECHSKHWNRLYEPNEFDSAKVGDVLSTCLKTLQTYAVLNDNGWHEWAELGWWGMTRQPDTVQMPLTFTKEELDEYLSGGMFGGFKPEFMEKVYKKVDEYYTYTGSVYEIKKGNVFVSDPDLKSIEFFPEKAWEQHYYDNFIKDLTPDTIISVVDFHI
jgi:hypothetical protein